MNIKRFGLLILMLAASAAQISFAMYPPQRNTMAQEKTQKLWDLVGRAHMDTLRYSEVQSLAGAAKQAIEAGANLNAVDNYSGETPLMRLAYSKTPLSLELAKVLIDKKADLDAKSSSRSSQGWTALDFAVFTNNFELADLLLKAGAPREVNPTVRPSTSMQTLQFVQGKKTLDQIRKEEYGPDYQNQPSVATKKLFELANEGYLSQNTPLEKAKQDIQNLINQGADLKENRLGENSFLTNVIAFGFRYPYLQQLVEFLIAKGAGLSQPSAITPLMQAAIIGDPVLVTYLISKGADRSKKHPRMGWTAYDLAVQDPARKARLARVLDLLDPNKPLPGAVAAKSKKGIFEELETPEFLNKK